MDGTRRHGRPVTARMVKNHPKCKRLAASITEVTTTSERLWFPTLRTFRVAAVSIAALTVESGKSTHHKNCHKVAHPSTFDTPATSSQMMVKAGDRYVKWLYRSLRVY